MAARTWNPWGHVSIWIVIPMLVSVVLCLQGCSGGETSKADAPVDTPASPSNGHAEPNGEAEKTSPGQTPPTGPDGTSREHESDQSQSGGSTEKGAPGGPVGQSRPKGGASSPLRIPLPTDDLFVEVSEAKERLRGLIRKACGSDLCIDIATVHDRNSDTNADGSDCYEYVFGIHSRHGLPTNEEWRVGDPDPGRPNVNVLYEVRGGTITLTYARTCNTPKSQESDPQQNTEQQDSDQQNTEQQDSEPQQNTEQQNTEQQDSEPQQNTEQP
jgi:hypothetical protein